MDTMVQTLLGEFMQEAGNTRKLLNSIPQSALLFRPSEKSWTTAELASHIANIYYWYIGVLTVPVLDMASLRYEREDSSQVENIVAKFEENAAAAKAALERMTDASLHESWTMVYGDKQVIPPMPRSQAMRGFLMNHLYHHRGEMIVYLRATGNKVPSIYGPVYEDNNPPEGVR